MITTPSWQDTREIFWRNLLTKSQLATLLKTMELDANDIPKRGKMRVISFPDGDIVGRIEWTKAVSEGGERLYSYELERTKRAEDIAREGGRA